MKYIRKIALWLKTEFANKETFALFLVVLAVMYSPVWGGYLLYALFHWKWCFVMATGYLVFWAGPFTPFFPVCVAVTLGVRRLIVRLMKRGGRKTPETKEKKPPETKEKKNS